MGRLRAGAKVELRDPARRKRPFYGHDRPFVQTKRMSILRKMPLILLHGNQFCLHKTFTEIDENIVAD